MFFVILCVCLCMCAAGKKATEIKNIEKQLCKLWTAYWHSGWGHFQVAFFVPVKTSLCANPFVWKCVPPTCVRHVQFLANHTRFHMKGSSVWNKHKVNQKWPIGSLFQCNKSEEPNCSIALNCFFSMKNGGVEGMLEPILGEAGAVSWGGRK